MIGLDKIIERLRSPHADKIFVAAGYTKADLIRDLEAINRLYAGYGQAANPLK